MHAGGNNGGGDLKLHGGEAAVVKRLACDGKRFVGGVVFPTQVGKGNCFSASLRQKQGKTGALLVTEVAVIGKNPLLKEIGIGPRFYHIYIVVGFDYRVFAARKG